MIVKEGCVIVDVPVQNVPSKKVSVFYNPVMKLNRDVCVLFLNSIKKSFVVADPLAGSGVRALRLLKECKNIKKVFVNDLNSSAVISIKKNAKLNNIKIGDKFHISNLDANLFLLEGCGFDFIDVDPFGCPNAFLDSAVKRVSRGGILAVTATDTSALSGTYPKACKRKYWAVPLRNFLMHEIGLRILVRKVQLVGAQFDKALFPVFCHSSDHYMRVYFKCSKGKSYVDKILSEHKFVHFNKDDFSVEIKCVGSCSKNVFVAGPVFCGRLWDSVIVKKMLSKAEGEAKNLLETVYEESLVGCVGFFDYYEMCSKLKCSVPKKDKLVEEIKKKGFRVSSTHFSVQGLRTDMPSADFFKLVSFLASKKF